MAGADRWIDLLDPGADELRARLPIAVDELTLERLAAPPAGGPAPRPTLQSHGGYVFGVFLLAVAAPAEDDVYYRQLDVVLTHDALVTVRKTPPGRAPVEVARAVAMRPADPPGMILARILDELAERYLDFVDDLDAEIDELENRVEGGDAVDVGARISSLRHQILHVRRTLAPMRDAVRRVVENLVEVEGPEVFPREVEIAFLAVYDKLLRALDGLDFSRDLVASVRDYHQARVATDQNLVMKRLTVVASLLLFPTFIVGVYGQNFERIPELGWRLGYAWSWGIIAVVTVLQLVFYRSRRWI